MSGFEVREMQGCAKTVATVALWGLGGLDSHLNLFLDRLRCVELPV